MIRWYGSVLKEVLLNCKEKNDFVGKFENYFNFYLNEKVFF